LIIEVNAPPYQPYYMARTTQQRTLSPAERDQPRFSVPLSEVSVLAAEIKAHVVAGEHDAARDRFSGLVTLQQRRAARIAITICGTRMTRTKPCRTPS
jgi:hypothetical protein